MKSAKPTVGDTKLTRAPHSEWFDETERQVCPPSEVTGSCPPSTAKPCSTSTNARLSGPDWVKACPARQGVPPGGGRTATISCLPGYRSTLKPSNWLPATTGVTPATFPETVPGKGRGDQWRPASVVT